MISDAQALKGRQTETRPASPQDANVSWRGYRRLHIRLISAAPPALNRLNSAYVMPNKLTQSGTGNFAFQDIHDSNFALLNLLQQSSGMGITPILLSRSGNTALRATRNAVVDANSLATYLPGTSYFPRVPEPVNTGAIDGLLSSLQGGDQPKLVTLDFIINLLGMTRSDSSQWNGTWEDEAIRACLRDLKGTVPDQAALVVRWNRNTSFPYRALLSSDDSRRYIGNMPTLTMYRENAGGGAGWPFDEPVWVPNLRFPDRVAPYIFTAV